MDQSRRVVLSSFPKNTPHVQWLFYFNALSLPNHVYVALRKSIHFREIFEWAFTDGVTTSVNMWLCCRQALVFWLNNFDYFTVWCLLLLCHLKRKLFKSTIMPVEVLISIVKDWYEWLVTGLVHLLSNDPFRRSGLMPCTGDQCSQLIVATSTPKGGSTYGLNRHRPPLLTDKSCKFSLFQVIFGLFSCYISHPAPLLDLGLPLFTYPGSAPVLLCLFFNLAKLQQNPYHW